MSTILKVAAGVFLGLLLWTWKDSIASSATGVLISFAISLILVLVWFGFSLLFRWCYARYMIAPRIEGYIHKHDLIESRYLPFVSSALVELYDTDKFRELTALYRRVELWHKDGLQTPQENRRIRELVMDLVYEYKAILGRSALK